MAITIGDLSKLTGISARAIRHYEQIGLLPSIGGRVRLFDEATLVEVSMIRDLREIGFSLDEIGVLIGKPTRKAIDFSPKISVDDRPALLHRLKQMSEKLRIIEEFVNAKTFSSD